MAERPVPADRGRRYARRRRGGGTDRTGGPWQLSLPAPQGPAHGGSLPKAPLVTGQGAVPSPVGGAPSTLPGDGSITPPKPVPPPPGGGEGRQRPHRPAALPPGQHRQD